MYTSLFLKCGVVFLCLFLCLRVDVRRKTLFLKTQFDIMSGKTNVIQTKYRKLRRGLVSLLSYENGSNFYTKNINRISEIENSEGLKSAEEEQKKAEEKLRKEFDGFFSNIPFQRSCNDLVEFLIDKLKILGVSSQTNSCGIVRCQLMPRRKGSHINFKQLHSGCALVIFESERIFTLLSTCRLHLDGRELKLQKGKGGWSSHKKYVKPPMIFPSTEIYLSTAPLGTMDYIWKSNQDVSISFDGSARCITLCFSHKDTSYVSEMPFSTIHQSGIGCISKSGQLAVQFRVSHPSRLYRNDTADFFEMNKIGVQLGMISNLTWEMNELTNEKKTIRTVDPTRNNSFGRSLSFSIVLRDKVDLQRIHDILQKFSLSSSSNFMKIYEIPIPRKIEDVDECYNQCIWTSLVESGLDFSILYWLHCLSGANKIDFVQYVQNSSLYHIIDMLVNTDSSKAINVLQYLYLDLANEYIIDFAQSFADASDRFPVSDDNDNEEVKKVEEDEETNNDFNQDAEDDLFDGTHNILVRRVLITPLRICPQPAEIEQSNRVTRHFKEHIDRFIRVTFVDESFGSLLEARSDDIFELRLRDIMQNGFTCGGFQFTFLAYSNSQIREQSMILLNVIVKYQY